MYNGMTVSIIFLLLSLVASPVVGLGQKAGEPEPLPPGHLPARKLKGGEAHSFRIRLKAGEYFHVDVRQRGIDVVLSIVDPGGKTFLERNRPNGGSGEESLSFIATTSGGYRLDVKPLEETAGAGHYEIESEAPHIPTAKDKQRIEAENHLQEGLRLSREKSVESVKRAGQEYEASAALWRDVGDKYAEALAQTGAGDSYESSKEYEKAVAAHERALSLYRELRDEGNQAGSLSRLCVLNVLLQKTDVGIAQFRQARAIYQGLNNKTDERALYARFSEAAEANLAAGANLFKQGSAEAYRQGATFFATARRIFQEIENKGYEALALVRLGQTAEVLGENQQALDYYKQAFLLYRDISNKPGIALTLSNMGSMYRLLGKKETALDYLENRALPLWKELENKLGLAMTFRRIGDVYNDIGKKQNALDSFNQAYPLYEERRDKFLIPTVLADIGKVHYDMGNTGAALDYLENRALPLWEEQGNKFAIATTLTNIGAVYSRRGEYRIALDYTENRALPIWIELKSKAGMALAFSSIGLIYKLMGKHEIALDYYKNRALPLSREVGDKADIAVTLNNIGSAYSDLGNLELALDYLEKQALPLYRELGDKSGMAITLNNIGSVYSLLGEPRIALDYLEKQALPLRREVEHKAGVATTLNNIGEVHSRLGDQRTALDYYENRALPLWKETGIKTGMASTLNNIGSAYSLLGEHRKALDHFENRALPLYREIGNQFDVAMILNNIGRQHFELGDQPTALGYFNRTLLLRPEMKDKFLIAATLNNNMLAWRALNPRYAVLYGKQSVNAYQQLRVNIKGLDNTIQKSFLKSVDYSYRSLAVMLIEQGRLVEAVEVLNALKDQQHFDFVPETPKKALRLSFTTREEELDSRQAAASDKVGRIARQIDELRRAVGFRPPTSEELTKLQQLEADLKTTSSNFAGVLKEAENEFKQPLDPVKDKTPDIDSVQEIQTALGLLGGKAVAVYTLVGKDKFYALLVTRADIIAVSTPVKGDRLNNKAKQLWALLQSDEYDPRLLSKEIYEMVFKPIKDRLIQERRLEQVMPEGATVMWSLDGNLRYLPVAALYDGEKYLVERYNNVVFTRAEAKRWTRDVSRTWTGVGFGSSWGGNVEHLRRVYRFDELQNVTEELNAVFKTTGSKSGVFKGDIFTDSRFDRDAMLTALKQERPLVLIASHFKFSPGDEEGSFLLMGDGKVFPLNEMKLHRDLFKGVELLTLSACETAAQWANSDGREVDAFAELAQRLGAGAVMATLWNVRDDSAYWLVSDFYQRKRDPTRQTKSESLRQAQIALLNGKAKVTPLTQSATTTAKKRGKNSAVIKLLPEGKEFAPNNEDGVVYIEARHAKVYTRNDSKPYAHPYFWSPYVLFGNWR